MHHRCMRDLDTDIPFGMYYDCENDVFRPINTDKLNSNSLFFLAFGLIMLYILYMSRNRY